MSLRIRLLASYLLLLSTTLSVIALALFLLLSTQPEPRITAYSRLSTLLQGFNLRELLLQSNSVSALSDYAQTRGVRVMAISGNGEEFRVQYDSDSGFVVDEQIRLRVDSSYVNRRLEQVFPRMQQIYGSFHQETEWLFSALVVPQPQGAVGLLVLAEPRSTLSLQQTLQQFGSTLGIPLVQSALAGLIVALILAALISRTIARPLQAVSQAASSVAEGHLDVAVPVSGPPEVRSVAEAFNRMSSEVRTTQQAQRDFLANVSHDLKTPLTSIQGYSQAIIDGTAKDPAHAAEIIYDEAARLNRMVIELTDLARIQAGRLSMQTAAIDMGQITTTVAKKLEMVARNKAITLEVNAPSLPEIAGDGDRLVQVVHNLIENAIKYTPNGGRVLVKTQVAHNGIEVIIADSGVGIPEKDLPRIFERFYQVDKARGPARGTGLGLAIVHEIVQAHGGHISVQSAPNRGTTFTLWFPSPHLSTVVRGRA